jgi:phosphoglycolate phosphatase
MSYDLKNVKAIVFDLDGTLINTVPDVLLALNHTLVTFGQSKIAAHEIHGLIGKGAKHLLKNAFKQVNAQLVGAEMNLALECYLSYYAAHPVVETQIYPDVVDVLQHLKKANINCGICTNKPGSVTRIVLDKLNLTSFFSAISCGDEVKYPKPDARHVYETLDGMKSTLTKTVFVGDSFVDQQSAENAGLPFIGVSYGYELTKSSSGIIINNFAELPAMLTQMTLQDKIA